MRWPTVIEWLGVAALATFGVALVVYVSTEALDDWAPNAGTEAGSIFVTVVIVGVIIKRAERARLWPWRENAAQDLNHGVHTMLIDIAVDYLATHRANARPIPRDGRELVEQWLADHATEDNARPDPRAAHTLVRSAELNAERFERDRTRHAGILEPVVVAALDDFTVSLRNACFIYSLAESMGWTLDRALKSSHRLVVEAVRDFVTEVPQHVDAMLNDHDMRVIESARDRLAGRTT